MDKYKWGTDYKAYDKELIEKLYNVRICGIPLSFYILDLRKTKTYCHITADFLSYCMKDSERIEGKIDCIIGNDKSHSWVEKNNLVYDTTEGLVWRKSSYYEYLRPTDCVKCSREQVLEEINEYLQYDENMNEMYIAWIKDLTDNIEKCPYRDVLKEHILRFKKEKKLDKQNFDKSLVQEYLAEMKKLYNNIDNFIDNSGTER